MRHSRAIVLALLASAAAWPADADEALDRALHQAARRGHFDVAQLLLEKGADPEARDTLGRTPLWTACFGQNAESDRVFELLLANGAKSTATDANGDAILIYAADIGRVAAVKALLARGAAVDVRTANPTFKGYTPLMKAAQRGRRDVVDVLIAQGADVRARNDTGQNALMEAAGHGQPEIVELLLARGVGVDESDKFDRTALMFAAMGGDVAMVDLLVARGADPRQKDGRGATAYTLAHPDKKEEIARALAKGEKR